MEQIVIYGAGDTGKSAYFCLKNQYKCLFFVDGDNNKWGKVIEGLTIKPPSILKQLKNVKIIVASTFWKEILEEISGYIGLNIAIYRPMVEVAYPTDVDDAIEDLNKRTIDLGAFLRKQKEIVCKELVFMPGGSDVLDYAFLKVLAEKYNCKNYLEIGTYIGESINILTDCCKKLFSITAPIHESYSMNAWCKQYNLPDYSERLTYNEKIIHFYADSKTFDFSRIKSKIDLCFIDGDHSYEGVYADTQNVFKVIGENAIIVWHDFRHRRNKFQYNKEVISAVKDALDDKFKNVYVTNRNYCGIYLPDVYIKDFEMNELKYEDDAKLYTYDVILKNCQIR